MQSLGVTATTDPRVFLRIKMDRQEKRRRRKGGLRKSRDQEGEEREGFFWPGRRATRKLARLPRMERKQGFAKVHKNTAFCRNQKRVKMSILTFKRFA